MFVPLSTTVSSHCSLVSILYFFIWTDHVRVRDWEPFEQESKAGAGLHALLMYCAVVFKGGLHVQMSDTQDRGEHHCFCACFSIIQEEFW